MKEVVQEKTDWDPAAPHTTANITLGRFINIILIFNTKVGFLDISVIFTTGNYIFGRCIFPAGATRIKTNGFQHSYQQHCHYVATNISVHDIVSIAIFIALLYC